MNDYIIFGLIGIVIYFLGFGIGNYYALSKLNEDYQIVPKNKEVD